MPGEFRRPISCELDGFIRRPLDSGLLKSFRKSVPGDFAAGKVQRNAEVAATPGMSAAFGIAAQPCCSRFGHNRHGRHLRPVFVQRVSITA